MTIYHEHGRPVEGSFRIDMREPDPAFVRSVLDFEDEYGHRVEPVAGEFSLALRRSRAFRFVADPELYLRRIEAGGLEDV